MMRKAGIVHCHLSEDVCFCKNDFEETQEIIKSFRETGPFEIVGSVSCRECLGEQTIAKTKVMVERGAEVIVFALSVSKGNPFGYTCSAFPSYSRLKQEKTSVGYLCPHYSDMRRAILMKVGPEIPIIECSF